MLRKIQLLLTKIGLSSNITYSKVLHSKVLELPDCYIDNDYMFVYKQRKYRKYITGVEELPGLHTVYCLDTRLIL